jgi:hypothetical protein
MTMALEAHAKSRTFAIGVDIEASSSSDARRAKRSRADPVLGLPEDLDPFRDRTERATLERGALRAF